MSGKNVNRRKFMMTLGIGGAAVAVAAVSGKQEPARGKGVTAGEKGASKGYQVTEHVRDYYRTCRV